MALVELSKVEGLIAELKNYGYEVRFERNDIGDARFGHDLAIMAAETVRNMFHSLVAAEDKAVESSRRYNLLEQRAVELEGRFQALCEKVAEGQNATVKIDDSQLKELVAAIRAGRR